MNSKRLFLGVDGGATRCRARLRDSGGSVLAEAGGAGANIYVDFEAAIGVISATITQVMAAASLAPAEKRGIAVGLGLAGVGSPEDEGRVAARLAGFADVRVANDAVTACLGAHAGEDGAVVIAGTGSAGLVRLRGTNFPIGGRGFILGDDGSAARIGHEALRHAMRAHDGLDVASLLTRQLMARFRDDPVMLEQWALTARPSDYGALAPIVFDAAERGDAVGVAIVRQAGGAIAALAQALRRLGGERIALVGGLADAIRPFLPAEVAALVQRPLLDATDGAILLAGGKVSDPVAEPSGAVEHRSHAAVASAAPGPSDRSHR
ncbi:MAG: N-acetylglucosamine kinase [Methylobacteriaceae bacterium]|nr:N-acetylglucosamine kinase [Methylobacteriaceae bacterium]